MSSRPQLVKPSRFEQRKRSKAQGKLACELAGRGELAEALAALGRAEVDDDLACLGLALSLATENTVGLTLWGGIVREAADRSERCASVMARVEAWDGESRFELDDFPELEPLLG